MPNTFPNIMIPEPRTIENHLYLLDRPDDTGPMMPTPTVLVDGSEMVLFGVGEHSDFQRLVHQLQSILPLDHLRYVVAPGMERQLVSTMTAFRDAGANPTFVVDEKLDRLMNLSAQGMPLKLVAKEDENL
ncbi:MAG TPA: hypothetical protein PLZ76_06420, partial [Bacillota bacterium]|nr:hypothetical protein [Bacillota bacterium]